MSVEGETNVAMTLGDDVVREILLWLPAASVLRCRAVCKAWRRIATDPSFPAAHADRRPPELLVAPGPALKDLDTTPLSLQADETRRQRLRCPDERCDVRSLADSCDGLLLFERSPPGPWYADFFLYNPVIRQGAWLDLTPPGCRGNLVLMCGIYRHGPSREYRILALVNQQRTRFLSPSGHLMELPRTGSAAHYVFSLGAGAGEAPRRLGPVADDEDDVVIECYSRFPIMHVQHRGKLHWTAHPHASGSGKILAFDTLSEAFRLIPRPPWPRGKYGEYDICLLETNGMLAVTATSPKTPDTMDLWVLEDYGDDGSWSNRFRIDLPPLFKARWSMGTGVPDVVLVGSYMCRFAGLYHLTEKRIVKQIEFPRGQMGTACHFVFKDSLLAYPFFVPC